MTTLWERELPISGNRNELEPESITNNEDINSPNFVQQLLSERNALRNQNSQLWKIIQKQRLIIQQFQKNLVKKEPDVNPNLLYPTEFDSEADIEATDLINTNEPEFKLNNKKQSKEKHKRLPSLVKNPEASAVPHIKSQPGLVSKGKTNSPDSSAEQSRSISLTKEKTEIKETNFLGQVSAGITKNLRRSKTFSSITNESQSSNETKLSESNLNSKGSYHKRNTTVSDSYKFNVAHRKNLISNCSEEDTDQHETDNENNVSLDVNYSLKKEIPIILDITKDREVEEITDNLKLVDHSNLENLESSTFHFINVEEKNDVLTDLVPHEAAKQNSQNMVLLLNHQLGSKENFNTISKKSSSSTIKSLPEYSQTKQNSIYLPQRKGSHPDTSLPGPLFSFSEIKSRPSKGSEFSSKSPGSTSTDSYKDAHLDMISQLKSLDDVVVHVAGSTIQTNSKGKEIFVFRIQVNQVRDDDKGNGNEIKVVADGVNVVNLWTIEKHFSDFLDLDNRLKLTNQLTRTKNYKLPENKSWSTSSPSKIDQRKHLLQVYLQNAINTNRVVPSSVSEFITSNLTSDQPAYTGDGSKEGYLIKRGKNFGKWKRRYFSLHDGVLEYFESRNGTKLGAITLLGAQVAVQQNSISNHDLDNQPTDTFRHAFMVLEPKKNSSTSMRHVLCADSDFERDQWVEALTYHLAKEPAKLTDLKSSSATPKPITKAESEGRPVGSTSTTSKVVSMLPGMRSHSSRASVSNQQINLSKLKHTNSVPDPTGGQNGSVTKPQIASNSTASLSSDKSQGSETKFGDNLPTKSRIRTSSSKTPAEMLTLNNLNKGKSKEEGREGTRASIKTFFRSKMNFNNDSKNSKVPQQPVFGVSLQSSVQASKVHDGYALSSVVYRCIQYLDAKKAHQEEGIYRLSGSSATIRMLKTKFDSEGDYNLLEASTYYDVHAVAGLLKLYLRELPSTVLTAELHKDFLAITDLLNRRERVHELGMLVCSLPIENYTLLRALIGHLIVVVQEAETNKMTLRNVGIVFAPTLGIPAGVFSLLMAEFKYVFFVDTDGSAMPKELSDDEDGEPWLDNSEEIVFKTVATPSIPHEAKVAFTSPEAISPTEKSELVGDQSHKYAFLDVSDARTRRRARHRRTMSAGETEAFSNQISQMLNPSNHSTTANVELDNIEASIATTNQERGDIRPVSSYSDTACIRVSSPIMDFIEPTMFRSTPLSPDLKLLPFTPSIPTHSTLQRVEDVTEVAAVSPNLQSDPSTNFRSNRNSVLYKNRAPPEIVKLEQQLDKVSDLVLEEDLRNDDLSPNEELDIASFSNRNSLELSTKVPTP